MTAHDIDTAEARSTRRAGALLLAVIALVVSWVVLPTPGASATEEEVPPAAGEEEPVTYEELQQQASQRAQEFFPEEYQEPSFFQWISLPVLFGGLVIALALLGAYLWWQPSFAAERRAKERRR